MKYKDEMNYSDFGDGPGVVRRTRSDRGKSTRHRFHPHNSAEFKDGAITSYELATIDPSIPPRRPANLFLLAPAKPIYFDADVSMMNDNIGFLCSNATIGMYRLYSLPTLYNCPTSRTNSPNPINRHHTTRASRPHRQVSCSARMCQ